MNEELLASIARETHENNIMLRQIIEYINYMNANAKRENVNDFGMNILANIIGNCELFNRR